MRRLRGDPRRARQVADRLAAPARGELGSFQQPHQSMYDPRRPSVWPVFPMTDIPAIVPGPGESSVLNPVKDVQKWFMLRAEDFPTAAIAANGRFITAFVAPPEENLRGDFEIVKLLSDSTGDFAVDLNQVATNRRFMNNPIPNDFIFGNAMFPAVLFETLVLETTTALTAEVVDLSGAPNTVRLAAEGRRFLDYGQGIDRQAYLKRYYGRRTHPYWLTFDDGSQIVLNNNATAEFTMTVPGAADLEVWQVMARVIGGTGAVDVEVFEGRSARSLLSGPVDLQTFFATPRATVGGFPQGFVRPSAFPHVWTFTQLFKRSSRMRVRFTNNAGAQVTIRMCFHGRLIYYNEQPPTNPTPATMRSLGVPMAPFPQASMRSVGPIPGMAPDQGPILPPR